MSFRMLSSILSFLRKKEALKSETASFPGLSHTGCLYLSVKQAGIWLEATHLITGGHPQRGLVLLVPVAQGCDPRYCGMEFLLPARHEAEPCFKGSYNLKLFWVEKQLTLSSWMSYCLCGTNGFSEQIFLALPLPNIYAHMCLCTCVCIKCVIFCNCNLTLLVSSLKKLML